MQKTTWNSQIQSFKENVDMWRDGIYLILCLYLNAVPINIVPGYTFYEFNEWG